MKQYYEVLITPNFNNFNHWDRQAEKPNDDQLWIDENDLLKEIADAIGLDIYPIEDCDKFGVEDIRGLIYGGDPEKIYFYECENNGETITRYFGISCVEV